MRHCRVRSCGSCLQKVETASPVLQQRPGTSPVLMYSMRSCLQLHMLSCRLSHTHMVAIYSNVTGSDSGQNHMQGQHSAKTDVQMYRCALPTLMGSP